MLRSPDPRIFSTRTARRRALLSVAAIVFLMAVGALAVVTAAPWLGEPEAVRAYVASYGPWAPVAFMGLQVVQVVLAPIPGQLLGVAGGYLFGPLRGTVYSMVGVTIGSYVVIRGSRALGRPAVERWVDEDVRKRFEDRVRAGGVPVLFLLYLLPAFPDDALCAIAGLTPIRIRTLMVLVVVGRTPSFLLVAYAGSSFAEQRVLEAAAILAAIGVLSLAVYLRRGRFRALLARSGVMVADPGEGNRN